MDRLQSILPKVLRKRGLHVQADASRVTFCANEWVKTALPRFADVVRVDRFSHAVLQISCSHSIAAQECLPLLPALKEYLQRECKQLAIEDIRLVRKRR